MESANPVINGLAERTHFAVRCRAIILHEGNLLLVRHTEDASYAALPGGHLEFGEDIVSCMRRELIEELGIDPDIGRLLYVNSFVDSDDVQTVEFFFEVKNGHAYADISKLNGTHAHELAEIFWASPADDVGLLPKGLAADFKAGKLPLENVRFLS